MLDQENSGMKFSYSEEKLQPRIMYQTITLLWG